MNEIVNATSLNLFHLVNQEKNMKYVIIVLKRKFLWRRTPKKSKVLKFCNSEYIYKILKEALDFDYMDVYETNVGLPEIARSGTKEQSLSGTGHENANKKVINRQL